MKWVATVAAVVLFAVGCAGTASSIRPSANSDCYVCRARRYPTPTVYVLDVKPCVVEGEVSGRARLGCYVVVKACSRGHIWARVKEVRDE